MNRLNIRFCVRTGFCSALVLLAAAVQGETVTWNVSSSMGSPKWWLGSVDNWDPKKFPTAEDYAVIPKKDTYSAGIYLDDGDDVTVGGFSFLRNCCWIEGQMTIKAGARCSVTDTSKTSYIGHAGNYNSKAYIDVYGTFVFGGAELAIRPCQDVKDEKTYGYTYLTVHDGGVMNVTNGIIRMTGGFQSTSIVAIPKLTNIVHVAEGGRMSFMNGTRLIFGAGNRDQAWASGGTLIVEGDMTFGTEGNEAIALATVRNSPAGGIFVTGEGVLDCGGRAIYFGGQGTNIVEVSGGGVITNAVLSYQTGSGDDWSGGCQRVDLKDGTLHLKGVTFGTSSGNSTQRNHIRFHGDVGRFYTGYFSMHTPYWNDHLIPQFFDFRLKAHTSASSVNGVTPIVHGTVTASSYNKFLLGYYRLAPEGGCQLIHRKTFTLQTREHLSTEAGYNYFDYIYAEKPYSFGGVLGTNLWSFGDAALASSPILGGKAAHAFNVTLRDDARLPDGEELSEPVVRGWVQLPRKREAPTWMNVYLKLVPETGYTVEGLVADMQAAGCDATAEANAFGGVAYNVKVAIPMAEFATGSSDEALLFDFEDVENYYAAKNESARVVKAKVAAAKTDYERKGLVLIVK